MEVSSDEDAGPEPDALIDQEKTPAGNDPGDEGCLQPSQKLPTR
jgi:hypothetical protein